MLLSIAVRWKNNCWSHLLQFIKPSNEDSTSTWPCHILANILDRLIAHAVKLAIIILIWVCIYLSILSVSRQQSSGESAHLQGSHEPSFLNTAMSTRTKLNVLAHLIDSLLLVIIYLTWFERINMKQLHINDHVPCAALCTKFNIKQYYTVKLSLINRNNPNKKSQWIVEVMVTIQY